MTNLPPDAQAILNEARTNEDFHSEHSDCLRFTGERSVDFMEYRFPLTDGRDLRMTFVDFSIEDCEVVEREPDDNEDEAEAELCFECEEPDPNK